VPEPAEVQCSGVTKLINIYYLSIYSFIYLFIYYCSLLFIYQPIPALWLRWMGGAGSVLGWQGGYRGLCRPVDLYCTVDVLQC
jgi:hypothetical protein